jgi:putative addiction module component (TIGR02574 family)
MSETATKLLGELLQLSEAERLQIADRLWDSLGDGAKQEAIDEMQDDPEFQAELQRRLKEVEEHPENLLDGEQVLREARERLQKRRQS